MQNLFLNISPLSTPVLHSVFQKISQEQKDRIEQKALDFKNPNKVINDIETKIANYSFDFTLSQKDFEKEYLILFNPILKPKLTINEQIEKLKKKGVKFNIMDEQKAKKFLTDNTFYYKLTAYRKNFEKDASNKYIDLDFVHLVDLSVIDMHISNEILKVCACIEHALKTKLLRDFDRTPEDGYSIINDFLDNALLLKHPISQDTVNKNRNKAIWQVVEDITLGELFKLCDFFYIKYTRDSASYNRISNLSSCIIRLRNAVSHNSCLIYNLHPRGIHPTTELVDYLYEVCFNKKIKKNILRSNLKNRFVHNFLGSLLALKYISNSEKIKYYRYKDFILLSKRVMKNKTYYAQNKTINLAFMLVIKSIIHFYKTHH